MQNGLEMQIGLLEAASQRRTESTMTKRKRTNTDIQDTHTHTEKTKDRATRTPPKTGGEFGCSGRVRKCNGQKIEQQVPH